MSVCFVFGLWPCVLSFFAFSLFSLHTPTTASVCSQYLFVSFFFLLMVKWPQSDTESMSVSQSGSPWDCPRLYDITSQAWFWKLCSGCGALDATARFDYLSWTLGLLLADCRAASAYMSSSLHKLCPIPPSRARWARLRGQVCCL